MKRKRYNKRGCRERGRAALIASTISVILLVVTWMYIRDQLATQCHISINLRVVVADVAFPLLAVWFIWDWLRYRRELKRSELNAAKGKNN